MKTTFYPPFTTKDDTGATLIQKMVFVEHQNKRVTLDVLCSGGVVCDVLVKVKMRQDECYGEYAEVAFLRAFQVVGYKGKDIETEAAECSSWLGLLS